jgi:hypothetical protein
MGELTGSRAIEEGAAAFVGSRARRGAPRWRERRLRPPWISLPEGEEAATPWREKAADRRGKEKLRPVVDLHLGRGGAAEARRGRGRTTALGGWLREGGGDAAMVRVGKEGVYI